MNGMIIVHKTNPFEHSTVQLLNKILVAYENWIVYLGLKGYEHLSYLKPPDNYLFPTVNFVNIGTFFIRKI